MRAFGTIIMEGAAAPTLVDRDVARCENISSLNAFEHQEPELGANANVRFEDDSGVINERETTVSSSSRHKNERHPFHRKARSRSSQTSDLGRQFSSGNFPDAGLSGFSSVETPPGGFRCSSGVSESDHSYDEESPIDLAEKGEQRRYYGKVQLPASPATPSGPMNVLSHSGINTIMEEEDDDYDDQKD